MSCECSLKDTECHTDDETYCGCACEQKMKMDILASTTAQEVTKNVYDKHGIKYSLYEEENRFKRIPIPEGYKAVYSKDEEFGIDFISLEKVKDER